MLITFFRSEVLMDIGAVVGRDWGFALFIKFFCGLPKDLFGMIIRKGTRWAFWRKLNRFKAKERDIGNVAGR